MMKQEQKHVTFDLVFVGQCEATEEQIDAGLDRFKAETMYEFELVRRMEIGPQKIWAVSFNHKPKFGEVKKLVSDRGYTYAGVEHLIAAKRSNKLAHIYREGRKPRDFYALGSSVVDDEGKVFFPAMTKFYDPEDEESRIHWLKMWKEINPRDVCTKSDTFLIVDA